MEKKVVEVNCHDCPASEGGCKHAVAFLMWVHRRSEEPSPTDKVCYWKRSVLAGASSTKKFITTEDFGAKPSTFSNDSFLNQYIVEAKKRKIENSTMRYHISQNYDCVSLHRMKIDFMSTNNINDAYIFLDYCKQQMDEDLLKQIEIKTRNQSRCSLWSEMRYARITASKAYDAAHCATLDGTLVENILGAKVFQTEAMKRGLDLEEAVLKVLSKETSQIFHKCGLFLSQECPVIGASPDAINEEYVVEIKCPFLDKTFHNFIDVDGNIKSKYYYQIQMQMHITKRQKSFYVVASPDFEKNNKITYKYCDYDKKFVDTMLNNLTSFWIKAIYNKI